jgi:sulfur-oxidizing protein SoxZ
MADDMKIQARFKDGVTEVKVLILHPMETGRRQDDFGTVMPAHFIQLVTATLNGKTVLEAQWGTGISKNPYLTFRLRDARPGDRIVVSWVDNKGATGSGETLVSER